jgi:multiple sugar transport system permease protein
VFTSWNNFLGPLIAITSTNMKTIPIGLATVQSAYGVHYAQIMATSVLAALPLIWLLLMINHVNIGYTGVA